MKLSPVPAALVAAALVLVAVPAAAGGGDSDGALLVVDPASPESMYVANYYRAARAIPDVNFVYMDPDAADYPTFAAVNVPALLGTIANARIHQQIDYVVIPPGGGFYLSAPGLLNDGCYTPERISISAGYTLVHIADEILGGLGTATSNRFFNANEDAVAFDGSTYYFQGAPSTSPSARRYFIGALLGYTGSLGNTLDEVLDMIDRSVAIDGTNPVGTFYFMQTSDQARSAPRHGAYPATVAAIIAAGGQAMHLYADLPIGYYDCQGIMTGLAEPDIDGADLALLPGSFADHLTSYAAVFDSTSQTKMSRWIAKGASGSSGAVEEPCNYPGKFPHAEMHLVYFKGMALGEAWLRKMSYTPFQSLLVGDPLTAPFARFPIVDVPNPPGNPASGVVTISPTATATAAGAQIARLELLVDGVHDQWAEPGEDFALDTRWYADGWHELRVLATDDAPPKNIGRWIGSIQIDNHGRSVTLAGGPATGDLSQAFDFTFSAAGGAASEVRLLQNGRVVAAAPAAAGTLRVFGQNLGAGPVRLRAEALFTDGRAARSEFVSLQIAYAPGAPLHAPPLAYGYAKEVLGSQAFVVELPAAYDDDPAGVAYTIVQPPAQATLLSAGSGPYRVYQPLPGATGTDSLSFQVTGAGGTSTIETVTLVYEVLPAAARYGCGVNPAESILLLDGTPALGRTLTVGLDNPLGTQVPGALAYLYFSLAPDANYPCGSLLAGFGMGGVGANGEFLINIVPPDPVVFLPAVPWAGVGQPAEFAVAVPADPALAGVPAYGQGLIHDISGFPFVPKFALTDAIELVLGHP
ncbi:MAG: hypothetical protein AB1726_04190 [Planctomycetota bacterium]